MYLGAVSFYTLFLAAKTKQRKKMSKTGERIREKKKRRGPRTNCWGFTTFGDWGVSHRQEEHQEMVASRKVNKERDSQKKDRSKHWILIQGAEKWASRNVSHLWATLNDAHQGPTVRREHSCQLVMSLPWKRVVVRHLQPDLLCLLPSLIRFGGMPCDTSVSPCFAVLFICLLYL